MSTVAPFDPTRFSATVPYYLRHRLRYPTRLILSVVETAALGPMSRVLDLGCGPGFLALSFAPYAGQVIGIDPDAAMLAAAAAEAEAAGTEVEWRQGSSFNLADDLKPLDLVAMGRSFHWMDREQTLRRLDTLVAPDGVLALFSDSRPSCPINRWTQAFDTVRDRHRTRDDYETFRKSAEFEPHFLVLLRSPFALVERIQVIESRQTSIEDQVGRALSQSSTAPNVLGARQQAFEVDMREALAPFANASGALEEIVEYSALLARRP